ncbi:MAG: hypothetical protein Q8R28_15650, partial [Dehalococcoidia bacterium]|nr:hypothetical protein [Dehalococcoidia bacterium]
MVTTSTNNRPSVGRARRPLSVTGLSIWRGQVQEEQLKDLERLPKRMQIFRQMRRDHVIGTALEAVKSPLTAADIDVSPGGESSVDKEAADFLWSVIGDMTQPWTRHVEDALELLDFGFSLGEMVFKRREGLQGPDGPSDFDDGAIGLSYISPIGQETLGDAFEPWKLDRQGNV